jgi:peptide-methionine (R)-S-oxide reductase
MINFIKLSLLLCVFFSASSCVSAQSKKPNHYYSHSATDKLSLSDAEWKEVLPASAYYILRQRGTESPNTGQYVHNHETGMYYCMGCGNALFSSVTKFESGTGWPSFYEPATKGSVKENKDASHGMVRTEVICARCGGHLGHVFDDGPNPTGLRYCMNGNALLFEKKK